jgi:hypothetical protein
MSATRTGSVAVMLMVFVVSGCGGSGPAADTGQAGVPPTTATTTVPTTGTTPSPSATPSKPAASIAGLPAEQIVKRAQAAAKAAASVRVRGAMTMEDGKPIKLDVSLVRTAGSGTITIDGAAIKVLVVGKAAYLQLSDAAWRQQAKSKQEANLLIQVMRGKWLKIALTNKDLGDLAAFASKPAFFDGLFDPVSQVRKTGTKTIQGIPCVGLGDGGGTLWVDATNARPIRLDIPGRSGTESLTFSEYNQIRQPTAPPAAQVIEDETLGR